MTGTRESACGSAGAICDVCSAGAACVKQACKGAVDAGVDAGPFEPIDGGPCDDAGACRNGFRCQAGHCELEGNGGRLQVTLRWQEYQDLDLYVDEPGDGLSCTVFLNSGDYCVGRFGADSVKFCRADAVKVETVVYREDAGIPRGHYAVSVRLQQGCEPMPKPWEFQVEIRREQSIWVIRKTLPIFGTNLVPVAEFDFP